jgi:hypothetical protein
VSIRESENVCTLSSLYSHRALNLPVYEYAFDDCKLMEHAEKCKLFFAAKIADIAKFREKIG